MTDNHISHKDAENPVVSVVVATYNSAGTVLETLESIKAQTYNNIELIVSDDCSQDNTIEVVNQWIIENNSRFVHAELVTTEKNTGVSGNFRRGIAHSKGEWIKSIAGDDLLIPTAIEEYICFVSNNTENVRMCVCDVECFASNGDIDEIDKNVKERYSLFFEKAKESYPQQRKRVINEMVFVGPTYFYSRDLYNKVGGFKEEYDCAEEWPFVYEVLTKGYRIYALNKKLVRYRIHRETISHSPETHGLPNKRFFNGFYRLYFEKRFIDLIRIGHPLTAWHYALYFSSVKCSYYIKNDKIQVFVKRFIMMFSPLTYIHKITNKLSLRKLTSCRNNEYHY